MARVLIIEDSPTQARELSFILEDAGLEVETAPDAERGLERLAEGGHDLVLSDLLLPGDSGFDVCRRIKDDPRFRGVRVVVCTSQADPLNVLRGLQAGADGFFTKNRTPDEIAGCIRRALARPPTVEAGEPVPVAFLGQEFRIRAGRAQLLDVLASAFEDVVHLNSNYQAGLLALRELNHQLGERNRELKRLADSEKQANEELKRAQSQLVQAEKLSSLGRMVGGVAHEINNPLAFVLNNLAVLQRDGPDLVQMVGLYKRADPLLAQHDPALLAEIDTATEEGDLGYLLENLGGLVGRSLEGLRRIERIVLDLRSFARLDESDLKEVDLNEGITTTALLLRERAAGQRVEIELDLAPLGLVTCYPAKVNQVVLNLLNNALDACPDGGKIRVSTRASADGVEIHVQDNGPGIDPAVRDKIFDPFFTTKPIGQGTGLGLSISYGIIQEHGGRIELDPSPGPGAHFVVHLPRVCGPARAGSRPS